MIEITKGQWKFHCEPTSFEDCRGDTHHVLTGVVNVYDGTKFLGDVCSLQSEENVGLIPKTEAFNNGLAIQMVPDMLNILDALADTAAWETAKLESLIHKAKLMRAKIQTPLFNSI